MGHIEKDSGSPKKDPPWVRLGKINQELKTKTK